MSLLKGLATAVAVSGLMVIQAFGLTVTNVDSEPHTLLIQKGDTETAFVLYAGGSLEEACEEGCVLRLPGAKGAINVEDTDGDDEDFVIRSGVLQREPPCRIASVPRRKKVPCG